MNAMDFATFGRVRRVASWAACAALAGLVACQPQEKKKRGDRSVRPLDGMEISAARNVSLETATDAMEQRDLKKLKMLDVYVRNRAEVALISKDDLSALSLAIACLENSKSRAERSAALDEIKSGKLKAPARALCLEEED